MGILSALALAGTVLAVLLVSWLFGLQEESEAYLEAVLYGTFTTWDTDALIDEASLEFLEGMSSIQDIEEIFHEGREVLGMLEDYRILSGGSNFQRQSGGWITEYTVEAEFARGQRTLDLRIFRSGTGVWRVGAVRIR